MITRTIISLNVDKFGFIISSMHRLKIVLKQFFYVTHTLDILDRLTYWVSKIVNLPRNIDFKKQNPGFLLPPDYFLFETNKLNYEKYKEDGELAALKIVSWTKRYLTDGINLLERGCGVARIIRHIPALMPESVNIVGADINKEMIEWDSANIPNVQFKNIQYYTPTNFQDNQFNLVFGMSVFTHIEAERQLSWIKEIHRILSSDGIFLFTTHVKKYVWNLNKTDLGELNMNGAITKSFSQKGIE